MRKLWLTKPDGANIYKLTTSNMLFQSVEKIKLLFGKDKKLAFSKIFIPKLMVPHIEVLKSANT